MTTLNQFFPSGNAGSVGGSIPTQVLVVNGGSGVYCLSGYSCTPYTSVVPRAAYIQGRGGHVARAFLDVNPGTTCTITVGAGGGSLCRSAGNPTSPCCVYSCCLGGSGCASRFGDFGGTDRTQPVSPTDGVIAVPYGADYRTVGRCLFETDTVSKQFTLDGTSTTCSYPCCTFNWCRRYTTGNCGGSNLTQKTFTVNACGFSCLYFIGFDINASAGYVSKITGTVQTYGAGKAYGFEIAPASSVSPFDFGLCLSRPHPNASGPGSGHGAYWCAAGVAAAEPGTVVIQYPDDFSVASVSSPSVCDCSPATPGYRTYRFLCPGSITFP